MLELLAVMAIAGLLGIGSVEGYQAAVRKNQANNILEGAAQRAIVVSQQAALDRDLDNITLGEFPTDAGRGASFPEKPKKLNDEFFSIPVAGLDEAACKQLQTMAGGALRRVDCRDANGAVTAELVYHKDLSTTADASDLPEGSSGRGNALTRAYDNDKEGCEGADYQYCADGKCITKEETCEGGSALCADTYPGTSEDNTGGYAGEVEGKTCRCPSQQAFNQNDKKCIPACSGHGTLDANEDCMCQGGYCGVVCENQVDCGEHGTWTPDKCECTEGWYGPLCDSDCDGFRGNTGTCYSCSEGSAPTTSQNECSRCDTTSTPREVVTTDGKDYCRLVTCPDNTYRFGLRSCAKCSDFFSASTWEERKYIYDFCSKNCNKGMEVVYSDTYSCRGELIQCNEEEFRDADGNCHPCSNPGDFLSYECSACDNTPYKRKIFSNNRCGLENCGLGNFHSPYGRCYSCSIKRQMYVGGDTECVTNCANTNYPRKISYSYCSLVTPNSGEEECSGNGIILNGSCVCYEEGLDSICGYGGPK